MQTLFTAWLVVDLLNKMLRPITAHLELEEALEKEKMIVDSVGDHGVVAPVDLVVRWQVDGVQPHELDDFFKARRLYTLAERRGVV